MAPASAKPDRTLLAILVIIATLVVIALAVVFLRGTPAPLDSATPEGVVQAYSAAVIDGDTAGAEAFLTQDLQENCERVDNGIIGGIRLTLVSTKLSADTARVRVAVVTSDNSGPFGGLDYAADDTFVLLNEKGSWAIETTPWQLTICVNNKGF
jgi:hypothetical protein